MKSWSEEFNAKLKPITEAQKEHFVRETQKYILIANDNGDGFCMRCSEDVHMGKTKHLEYKSCPNCGKTLKIHHNWRASLPNAIGWHVIAKAMNDHVLCLRYVSVRNDRAVERGRIYIDEYRSQMEYWCHSWWQKDWTFGKQPFFVKPNVFNLGSQAVYDSTPYMRTWFKECSKLRCFGKYNPIEKVYDKQRYPSQMHYLMRSAKINEMLTKCGLDKLADYHLDYYMNHGDTSYPVDNKATTIHEVLKLSKHAFKVWKDNGASEYQLKVYQKWEKKFGVEKVKAYLDSTYSGYADRLLTDLSRATNCTKKKPEVIEAYVNRKNISLIDYADYVVMLKKLEYNMEDKQYIMPKDFAKSKTRVCNEYNEMLERKRLEEIALREKEALEKLMAKDNAIKKISDALRKMPDLQRFMQGSNGLLVYVPDSTKEMFDEGKALHNCISSYADRVAQNKTLLFFIRQLNNPTAPFVAMEYCNGQIIQCRYDNNEDVRSRDDDVSKNIINFAEALASTLRENKVLAA